MIFNMQMGFILLEVGVSRKKHSRNVLLKNIIDTLVCIFGFWFIGYGLSINAQGGIMGNIFEFNQENENDYYIRWLIAFSFCNTSSTIVSGCVAERMHNDTYLVYSLLIVCFVYPVCSSWVWGGGWLSLLKYHDYAGSGCIHMVGGFAGLIHTLMLGPRLGFSKKFDNSKFNYGK
jgi:Amt family ammonium transporter